MGKIRVLVADDSLVARELIAKVLGRDPQIEVVGKAKNGKETVELVSLLKPDLITMDLRMPVMDGFGAIEQIMAWNPTPILVVTATSFQRKREIVFDALSMGALDIVEKPSLGEDLSGVGDLLIQKVKMLAQIPVVTHLRGKRKKPLRLEESVEGAFKLVAIGASTGGPRALRQILSLLPADLPAGIVIVQHITKGFVPGLVEWLNKGCKIRVKEAIEGEKVAPGLALISPEGQHLEVMGKRRIRLSEDPPVEGHRPSADLLLSSVAQVYGPDAIGVLLTGMGSDGARGMKLIKDLGGQTIAQDEGSCVVFGMPKAAIEMGGVDKVVPLDSIAREIIRMLWDQGIRRK